MTWYRKTTKQCKASACSIVSWWRIARSCLSRNEDDVIFFAPRRSALRYPLHIYRQAENKQAKNVSTHHAAWSYFSDCFCAIGADMMMGNCAFDAADAPSGINGDATDIFGKTPLKWFWWFYMHVDYFQHLMSGLSSYWKILLHNNKGISKRSDWAFDTYHIDLEQQWQT